MKRLLGIVRPIALAGVSTGILISQLWFLFLWYDECASRFVLSDKVQGLHRLLTGIAVVQWLMLLMLIWILETVMVKRRTAENAEPAGSTEPGDSASVSDEHRGRRVGEPGRSQEPER